MIASDDVNGVKDQVQVRESTGETIRGGTGALFFITPAHHPNFIVLEMDTGWVVGHKSSAISQSVSGHSKLSISDHQIIVTVTKCEPKFSIGQLRNAGQVTLAYNEATKTLSGKLSNLEALTGIGHSPFKNRDIFNLEDVFHFRHFLGTIVGVQDFKKTALTAKLLLKRPVNLTWN